MPFSYDQLEDTLVAYLAPILTNCEVVTMPENEAEFKRQIKKTRLTIWYTESSFQDTTSPGFIKQMEEAVIMVNVQSNKRRGAGGLNEALGLAKKYLQGYKLLGDQLKLKKIEFHDRDAVNNVWSYDVQFTIQKMQVQDIEPNEAIGANLQQVQWNEQVQLP